MTTIKSPINMSITDNNPNKSQDLINSSNLNPKSPILSNFSKNDIQSTSFTNNSNNNNSKEETNQNRIRETRVKYQHNPYEIPNFIEPNIQKRMQTIEHFAMNEQYKFQQSDLKARRIKDHEEIGRNEDPEFVQFLVAKSIKYLQDSSKKKTGVMHISDLWDKKFYIDVLKKAEIYDQLKAIENYRHISLSDRACKVHQVFSARHKGFYDNLEYQKPEIILDPYSPIIFPKKILDKRCSLPDTMKSDQSTTIITNATIMNQTKSNVRNCLKMNEKETMVNFNMVKEDNDEGKHCFLTERIHRPDYINTISNRHTSTTGKLKPITYLNKHKHQDNNNNTNSSKDFIKRKHQETLNNHDHIYNIKVKNGPSNHFKNTMNHLKNHYLSEDSHYEHEQEHDEERIIPDHSSSLLSLSSSIDHNTNNDHNNKNNKRLWMLPRREESLLKTKLNFGSIFPIKHKTIRNDNIRLVEKTRHVMKSSTQVHNNTNSYLPILTTAPSKNADFKVSMQNILEQCKEIGHTHQLNQCLNDLIQFTNKKKRDK